jgi:hypothetical protein
VGHRSAKGRQSEEEKTDEDLAHHGGGKGKGFVR